MNPAPEPTVSLRRLVYALLITLAAGTAAGRILSAMLVYEPVIFKPSNPEEARGDFRRVWPGARPSPEPTFSSNDRSRWAAVRTLVDEGTWVIGRRSKEVVLVTALGHLGAGDPLQLAALAEAGYRLRLRSDEGIVFEDGWQTVDKVMNPVTFEYYSTKPPLLTA